MPTISDKAIRAAFMMDTPAPRYDAAAAVKAAPKPKISPRKPPRASLSAYKPSLGEKIQDGIASGLSGLGVSERYANHFAGRAIQPLSDLTPVGDAMSFADAGTQFGRGNYGAAGGNFALGAIGAIPGLGDAAARGIREAVTNFRVKPPKKLYRGLTVNADDTVGMGDAFLGRGLYSTPSKSYAKRYAMNRGADMQLSPNGAIQELAPDEAWPTNPLVLNGQQDAGAVFRDWLMREHSGLRMSEINQKWPDPADYVRSLGFDGVVVGDEVVKYPSK